MLRGVLRARRFWTSNRRLQSSYWRNDNINTYQYGVRDGVVRDGVGIVGRSGVENVVRFELGESGDSRVRDGIRDAVSNFDL